MKSYDQFVGELSGQPSNVYCDNCHLYYCCVSSRRGAERRAMQHYQKIVDTPVI